MAVSSLSLLGLSRAPLVPTAKARADLPPFGRLVEEFDVWRPGYDGAVVAVQVAGTTTLADVYADPSLTTPAANPQVLLTRTDATGRRYGRFERSLYTPWPYALDIDTVEQTGRQGIPIERLAGQDASLALVAARGGSRARTLAERAGDRVNVLDHGDLTDSAAGNTATLAAAIAAAAALGGGVVHLPPGVIPFHGLALPQGVVLAGQGRGVTVLQSEFAGVVIDLTGDRAGLAGLTLDGIQLHAGSVGVHGKARRHVTLMDVEIRRFDTGIKHQGGRDHIYRRLYVTNCTHGARLLGDDAFTGGGGGDEFSGLDWFQGHVAQCTGIGLDLTMVDMPARHNAVHQVDFTDNVGDQAIYLYGASWAYFRHCTWAGNSVNLQVRDNADITLADRECVGLRLDGGQIAGGRIAFDGLCQDFVLEHMELIGCTLEANMPRLPVLLRDCVEIDTVLEGDGTKIARWRTGNHGTIKGGTTDATPAAVWKTALRPGEVVLVEAKVTAEQINGVDHAAWHVSQAGRCAPATLTFDEQSADFTIGATVTGQTAGATAVIVAQNDGGTTGTLSLSDVAGGFVDDELIQDSEGGQARVNGALAKGSAAVLGSLASHYAFQTTGASAWAVAFQGVGQELQLVVTGGASATLLWNVEINLTVL